MRGNGYENYEKRWRIMKEQATSQRYLEAVEGIKDVIAGMLGNIESAYEADGYVLDYSPDDLMLFARHNGADQNRDAGIHVSRTFLTNISVGEGAFLGEVVIRNLGGEWVYPSYARMALFQILMSIGFPITLTGRIIFPKIQVKLNGRLIPVMTIGRLRVKWDERVFSLKKAYEEIRTTGKWSGNAPLTDLEKRILKEKRQMWRIERWSWLYDPRNHRSRTINQFIRGLMIEREYIRASEIAGGGDYSPGGLRKIDEFFSKKNLRDRMKSPEAQRELQGELGRKNFFLHICRGVGGYLGEVIVRRLGGEWVYPTIDDFLDGQKKHQDIRYLHDRCFVKLGDNLIPIMTIAQLRLEDKIPSITAVYEEIKLTGKWIEKKP